MRGDKSSKDVAHRAVHTPAAVKGLNSLFLHVDYTALATRRVRDLLRLLLVDIFDFVPVSTR